MAHGIQERGPHQVLATAVEPAEEGEGAAWRGRYAAVYVCTDHHTYGHQPRFTRSTAADELPDSHDEADAHKEAAREQRRLTIDNNKAWRSAETSAATSSPPS